ncbi:MAG TPA: MFS transporter [Candidatus Limnocylindrales bacterium]|nr:MFS transporter [Candidatus Limnocylindrales bacterium]
MPTPFERLRPRALVAGVAGWARRWNAILPLLAAELIVWLGFGALLPIMPLYFTEHGVDLQMLGVVVAAWPAARLVGEPVFGWVADRTRRVPLMVAGNVGAGIFLFLPLVFVGVVPFTILRALAGLATAMYDPAARGYIADATPPDRRGEAFGVYGAAQMGGLLLGPAIGGLGATIFGGVGFIFVFGGISSFAAAAAIAWRVRELPHVAGEVGESVTLDVTELGARPEPVRPTAAIQPPPTRLMNRWIVAAILFTVGGNFAYGTYEVIWSLFLERLGAGLELIGLTFAMFGVPIIVLSPWFGRRIDRASLTPYLILGTALPVLAAIAYTQIRDPILSVPLILVESTGSAIGGPAMFTIVAAGSPEGRSSTAQGIVGASGTLGFVIASLVAGAAAAIDIRLPFYLFAIVMTTLAGLGLIVARPKLRERAAALSRAVARSGAI